MIRSSHKNSNSEKTKSISHHFCPGLPVSLTLCPIKQCCTLSQAVSVQRFAEAAQRAVGVRADCNAVKMCGNVPHCLMAVSVQRFAEAAQRAVGVRADCNAVKMCAQTVMSNAQSKLCNCLSSWPVCYFGYYLLPRFMGQSCLQFMSLYTLERVFQMQFNKVAGRFSNMCFM